MDYKGQTNNQEGGFILTKLFKKRMKHSHRFRFTIYALMFINACFTALFLISFLNYNGVPISMKFYNEILVSMGGGLYKAYSNIPFFGDKIGFLNIENFYKTYGFNIDKGVWDRNINLHYFDFMIQFFILTIPLIVATWMIAFSTKIKIKVNEKEAETIDEKQYENYTKNLPNMKETKNPLKKLETFILSDGTQMKDSIDMKDIKKEAGLETYMKLIENVTLKRKYKGFEMNGAIENIKSHIKKSVYKNINDRENIYYEPRLGRVTNRELYFPSINQEVSMDQLISYYQMLLMFNLAKSHGNFSVYSLSRVIDAPDEIKRMAKNLYGNLSVKNIMYKVQTGSNKSNYFFTYSEIFYRVYRYKRHCGFSYKHLQENVEIKF